MSIQLKFGKTRVHRPMPLLGGFTRDTVQNPKHLHSDSDVARALGCSHVLVIEGNMIRCIRCPMVWRDEGF